MLYKLAGTFTEPSALPNSLSLQAHNICRVGSHLKDGVQNKVQVKMISTRRFLPKCLLIPMKVENCITN